MCKLLIHPSRTKSSHPTICSTTRRRPGCGGVGGAPPRDRVRLPAAIPPRDGDLVRPHSPRDRRPRFPDATASRRPRRRLTATTTLQPRCSYPAATRWPRRCCTRWRSGGLGATPTRGRPNGLGAALIRARPDEPLQHCPRNSDLAASTLLDVMATLQPRRCLHTECCNALFLTECPMVLARLNVAT